MSAKQGMSNWLRSVPFLLATRRAWRIPTPHRTARVPPHRLVARAIAM
jgi:hypothetical protein